MEHRIVRTLRGLGAALVLGVALSACGREDLTNPDSLPPGSGGDVTLEVAAGDGQAATVDDVLPTPLVVRAVDSVDGTPVSGVEIQFVVAGGDGDVTPSQATTSANGEVSATWSLGTTAGPQSVQARLDGAPEIVVEFQATGMPGPPASIESSPGNAQAGEVGQPLSPSVVAIVADAFGNQVPGVAVEWEVLEGDGSLSDESTETDAQGQASVVWTLGTTAGPQQIGASFSGSSQLLVNATAQPGPPDPDESDVDVNDCGCLISILDLIVIDDGVLDLAEVLPGGLGDLIDDLLAILTSGELVSGDALLQIQVTVRDEYGNLIPDVDVFVEVSGVGTDLLNDIAGNVTLTTADEGALLGVVDLDWELLGDLGLHQITVTVEGLDPILIDADVD